MTRHFISALFILLAAAFHVVGAFAGEAPPQPRSHCVDMDTRPLYEERVCFPHLDGYDLFVSRDRGDVYGGEDSVIHFVRVYNVYYEPADKNGRVLYLFLYRSQSLPTESRGKLVDRQPEYQLYGELLTEVHNNPHGHDSADRTLPYNVLRRNANGSLFFEACPYDHGDGGWVDAEAEGQTAHQSIARLVHRYLAWDMSDPTGCQQ